MRARTFTAFLTLPLLALSTSAQRDSDFMKQFRQAMGINAQDEMVRLVRQNQDAAQLAIVETCEKIAVQSSDELEDDIDQLGKAWRKAFDSRFAQKQYEYVSFLSGEYKRSRIQLARRYELKVEEFTKARDNDEMGKIPAIGMDFSGFVEAFEELGDLYFASQSAFYYANCFDDGLLGDNADYKRACSAYGKVCELRKRIELEDRTFLQCKERFDYLEYEGYGDPEKGPEARKAARAEEDASFAPAALEANFEMVEELDGILRPNYQSDPIFQVWTSIWLEQRGSTTKFPAISNSPAVVREGAVKASVDLDGDGSGDVEIPLGGVPKPVKFTLGDGDAQREWAFFAAIGQDRDFFQGYVYNMAPNKDAMQIFVAPAGSVVGMIGETRIQVFDDNMDGIYGSPPYSLGYWGMREGDYQYNIDTILIGESKRALPWSHLNKVGDNWYRFLVGEAGEITVQKDEIPTGKIKLDYKGPGLDYLILQGTGKVEHVFVDLMPGAKRGTEVPAGTYELFSGRASKGKRKQMMKALVLPSRNTPRWTVAEGGETTVELGSPFGFDFSFSQDDKTITVDPKSIVITGKSGETYQRLWNCPSFAEIHIRKAGTKRGAKAAKFRPAGSQIEIETKNNDVQAAWFPMFGAEEPIKKKNEGDHEVMIFEKKNKLFGKVESDWKGE